jgi:AcrR family transcriptional regulator
MVPSAPPKHTKRERTRKRLLETASEIIREKGFYKTTLEDVARRAGMTRGAIYGNFKNKDELFLAVVETRWRPIIPIKHGATLKEHMRIVGEAVVAAIPARRAQALGALSFQIYALTHEEMRSRVAEKNAELYRRAAERLQQLYPTDDFPMPVEQFVRALHALTDGLVFLRFIQPELMTDDMIIAAFESLAPRHS